MAKVILSRKGFDSSCGGYPSPILPDGTMISLPIPAGDNENVSPTYKDLKCGDLSYLNWVIKNLISLNVFYNNQHLKSAQILLG
jgi:hypothetical protein